jgi:hypothetical protein
MPGPTPERRRAVRAKAAFPIQIGPGDRPQPASLKDLSEIGLCCVSRQAIPEMATVAIDLQFPGQKDRHRVNGAVVRCQRLRGSKEAGFEVAVYFLDAGDRARAALRSWVERGQPV